LAIQPRSPVNIIARPRTPASCICCPATTNVSVARTSVTAPETSVREDAGRAGDCTVGDGRTVGEAGTLADTCGGAETAGGAACFAGAGCEGASGPLPGCPSVSPAVLALAFAGGTTGAGAAGAAGFCWGIGAFCRSLKKLPSAEADRHVNCEARAPSPISNHAQRRPCSRTRRSCEVMFHRDDVLARGTSPLYLREGVPAAHVNEVGWRHPIGELVTRFAVVPLEVLGAPYS
jgi:hypothetical protein